MTTAPRALRRTRILIAIALTAFTALAALPSGRAAATVYGGISAIPPEPPESPANAPADRAMLLRGRAIAPLDAPAAVKEAIQAANQIRSKPYIWGGGHGRWQARGYDCSGAVSYALHGAGLLSVPMVSGSLAHWGEPGRGRWITIYANAGHVYAVIAGLRWDTVGDTSGTGPRWHENAASPAGFVVRHPPGY
jgi:hypothetical protein